MKTIWVFFISSLILLLIMMVFSMGYEIEAEDVYSFGLLLSVPLSMGLGLLLKVVMDILKDDVIQLKNKMLFIPIYVGSGSVMSLTFIPIYNLAFNTSIWSSYQVILGCLILGGIYITLCTCITYILTLLSTWYQRRKFKEIDQDVINT